MFRKVDLHLAQPKYDIGFPSNFVITGSRFLTAAPAAVPSNISNHFL
jgi:hypothetical protein